jgi:hypothetical protein
VSGAILGGEYPGFKKKESQGRGSWLSGANKLKDARGPNSLNEGYLLVADNSRFFPFANQVYNVFSIDQYGIDEGRFLLGVHQETPDEILAVSDSDFLTSKKE